MKQKITIAEAMEVLTEALRTDSDYKQGWVANIAMAFHDQYYDSINDRQDRDEGDVVHEIFNKAAERFINNLTHK